MTGFPLAKAPANIIAWPVLFYLRLDRRQADPLRRESLNDKEDGNKGE